jgi:preprotein translocase subunit SecA
VRHFLRFPFSRSAAAKSEIQVVESIRSRRRELAEARDDELRTAGGIAQDLQEVVAVTAEVAKRLVGLDLFDAQIRGALARS